MHTLDLCNCNRITDVGALINLNSLKLRRGMTLPGVSELSNVNIIYEILKLGSDATRAQILRFSEGHVLPTWDTYRGYVHDV